MKIKALLPSILVSLLYSCAPEPVHVTDVILDSKALTLEVGTSERLTATVSPNDADNSIIIWSSDNASVAKVSSGLVTAVAPGTARITASSDDGGKSDVCVVTVPIPYIFVTGVSLNQTAIELDEGSWIQLKASVSPSNADDPSLRWTSSNQDVAQVTSDGTVLAMTPGVADITVTTVDGEKTATCKVTVKNRVTSLTLEPDQMDLVVGDESDIVAKLEPAGAKVQVNWKSASPERVSVDEKGHIKALSAGNAVICASTDSKGIMAFCKIHVRNKLQSVSVTTTATEVFIGETLPLTVTVLPANLPDTELTWTSSNSSVATVNANGVLSAKAKGTVTVSATVKNGPETKSGSVELKVIQPVTSITVSPDTYELYAGEEVEIEKVLSIKVTPSDADDPSWKYGMSAAGIINVEKGKLTGLKAGKVTLVITPNKAKSDVASARCSITVKAKVESVSLSGESTRTVHVGGAIKLSASVSPSNANQEIVWSSSKPEFATVDEKGTVTGIKAGETVITAASKEDPEKKASCTVTVQNIAVNTITLNQSSLSIVEGNTYQLTATVKPDNAFEKNVTWTSSNSAVATVSSTGLVTAIAEGTATITASCGGKTATCAVSVDPKVINVTSVTLNQTSVTVEMGEGFQLIATVLPEKASNKDVTWSSSNTSIARVDSFGKVTTSAIGSAVITVTTVDGAKTANCAVTVTAPPVSVSSIVLPYNSYTLTYGQTLDLSSASVLPTDATDKTLVWTSSDTSVASVTDGIVKAASKAGTTTITATSQSNPSVRATCSITVKSQIILVSKISISPSSLDLYLNQTYDKLTYTVTPSNADNKNIKWSVPQGGVASVDQNGIVTAVREGTSLIIAKSEDGNAQATIRVTVSKNAVASVSLESPSEITLKAGETYPLKVKVNAVDTKVPASNSKVTWKSSSTSVATVDSSGRITAKASGTATITVTSSDDSSKKATCKVTVLASGSSNGGSEGIDFEDWNF